MIDLRTYKSKLDRGVPRLKEGLWLTAQFLFFALPYPLPSAFRVWILRRFGAKIGCKVVIRSGVRVSFPWRLTVGDYSWIGEDVSILSLDHVTIGANCCVSQRAFLCTGSHRFDRLGFDLVTKPIRIHDGVWVAAQVFVAPGIEIGANSMCIAGSVVLDDVPAGCIVQGNPAVIRSRRDASCSSVDRNSEDTSLPPRGV
jgi:putative colanic acid biosynthesis acetyltransferase WcaF